MGELGTSLGSARLEVSHEHLFRKLSADSGR